MGLELTEHLNSVDVSDQISGVHESQTTLNDNITGLDELESALESCDIAARTVESQVLWESTLATPVDKQNIEEVRKELEGLNEPKGQAVLLSAMFSMMMADGDYYHKDWLSTESAKYDYLGNGEYSDESIMSSVTDGVKSVASKAIPILGRAIVSGWETTNEYYHRAFSSIESMTREMSAFDKRLLGYKNKDIANMDTELRRETVSLTLGHAVPKNARDIVIAITAIREDLEFILNQWSKEVKSVGEHMLDVAKKHNSDAPYDTVVALNDAVQKLDFKNAQNKLKATINHDIRFGNVEVFSGQDLPGNYALFVFRPELSLQNKENPMFLAKALRRRQIKLMNQRAGGRQSGDATTIKTLSIDEIEVIMKECRALLHVMEVWSRSGTEAALEKTGQQIKANLDRLSLSLTNRDKAAYNNAAYHYASAYLKWATQPATSLCSQSLVVIRAAMIVCNRSLSNYQ